MKEKHMGKEDLKISRCIERIKRNGEIRSVKNGGLEIEERNKGNRIKE